MHALVTAEDVAGGVGDDPAAILFGQPVFDKARIVPVGDKADLLAVGLVCHRQAPLVGIGPDLGLFHVADGKRGVGQLILCERKQEIRLVLLAILAASEAETSVRAAINAGIVARRHDVRIKPRRTVDEGRKLEVAIAMAARNRRAAGRVLTDEVVHHCGLELALEIQDVVWNSDRGRDLSGILQVIEGAAASEAVRHALALVVQLHREADDVVAGIGQPRGGHRRVHSSRHGDDYAHGRLTIAEHHVSAPRAFA